MTADLTDEFIARHLTGAFGKFRRVFGEIDSTNDEALRWAVEEGAPEGALVVADYQTAGRGRRGRSWIGDPGRSLMFSLVLRPSSSRALALVTTAAGVAVSEALETLTGLDTRIKWPNDVLAGGRKLAGILVETRLTGSTVDAAVLGAGVNLYPPAERLPDELAARTTSVDSELGPDRQTPSRAELLGAVLGSFEAVYPLLDARGAEVVERARSRSAVLGAEVVVRLAGGEVLEGVAEELLDDGSLGVRAGDELVRVGAGEIERLRSV